MIGSEKEQGATPVGTSARPRNGRRENGVANAYMPLEAARRALVFARRMATAADATRKAAMYPTATMPTLRNSSHSRPPYGPEEASIDVPTSSHEAVLMLPRPPGKGLHLPGDFR